MPPTYESLTEVEEELISAFFVSLGAFLFDFRDLWRSRSWRFQALRQESRKFKLETHLKRICERVDIIINPNVRCAARARDKHEAFDGELWQLEVWKIMHILQWSRKSNDPCVYPISIWNILWISLAVLDLSRAFTHCTAIWNSWRQVCFSWFPIVFL